MWVYAIQNKIVLNRLLSTYLPVKADHTDENLTEAIPHLVPKHNIQ